VEEGTICPIGSAVSSTAKDTLPEAAAQKELRLRPRHRKSQGTRYSEPEPSGYKLTENQTVQKIAWRIPWCARSKRSSTHYKTAAYQWNPLTMEVDTGAFP